jgi:GT2 family glycosyltransferase
MRREVFEMLGGFDERFSPGYYEDVDLCRRAYEAGLTVLYVPSAVLYHHEGGSFKQGLCDARYLRFRNRIRFVFKHFPVDQILGAFIPAMTQGLARRRPEELRAVARGSLDAMLIWPEVAPQHLDGATKRRVVQAFRELRDRAVYLEITPKP